MLSNLLSQGDVAIFIQLFFTLSSWRAGTHLLYCLNGRTQSQSSCPGCLWARERGRYLQTEFNLDVLKWDEVSTGFFSLLYWLSLIDQTLTLRTPKAGEVNPALWYCQAEAVPREWLRQQPCSRGQLSSEKLFVLKGVYFLGMCWVWKIKVMDTQKYWQAVVRWPFQGALFVPEQWISKGAAELLNRITSVGGASGGDISSPWSKQVQLLQHLWVFPYEQVLSISKSVDVSPHNVDQAVLNCRIFWVVQASILVRYKDTL